MVFILQNIECRADWRHFLVYSDTGEILRVFDAEYFINFPVKEVSCKMYI